MRNFLKRFALVLATSGVYVLGILSLMTLINFLGMDEATHRYLHLHMKQTVIVTLVYFLGTAVCLKLRWFMQDRWYPKPKEDSRGTRK